MDGLRADVGKRDDDEAAGCPTLKRVSGDNNIQMNVSEKGLHSLPTSSLLTYQ